MPLGGENAVSRLWVSLTLTERSNRLRANLRVPRCISLAAPLLAARRAASTLQEQRCARETTEADVVLFYAGTDSTRCGALIEAGAALEHHGAALHIGCARSQRR